MSIYFDLNYSIHADAFVSGYTAGIKFSPDGTIYCRYIDDDTGNNFIKFEPNYVIQCGEALKLNPIVLNKFKPDYCSYFQINNG